MVYFDNAATTKPGAGALEIFTRCAAVSFGNPSSPHFIGKEARALVDQARREVASAVGAPEDEIVFTSGGTEAANLAIQGVCAADRTRKKIVISAVEHPAVYKTCSRLAKNGYSVIKIPVSLGGDIDEEMLAASIDGGTALVSFMSVNNETGTVLPIERIVRIVKTKDSSIPVHTDAVQALGKIHIDVKSSGVDLLSVSGHKVHGFKGVGALYVKNDTNIYPTQFGGGQEKGLRSGTEAVGLIASFGRAAAEAVADLGRNYEHISGLKARFLSGLGELPEVTVNSKGGVPHIVNFSVPGRDAGGVLEALSGEGYCVSRGAACKSNHRRGPSMLMSFGLPADIADAALRVSFSRDNTLDEVDGFFGALMAIFKGYS